MQRFVHRSNGWSLTPAARVVAGILAFSLSGCLGLDEVTCVDVSECATGEACLAGVCQTADSGGGGDVDADTDDGITPDAPDADDTSDVPEDVADSGDTAPDGDTDDRDVNDAADATDTADSGDAADAADSDGSSDTDATDGSGACEARNACGGCEVLSDVPGSDCGPCDLDQIVCV